MNRNQGGSSCLPTCPGTVSPIIKGWFDDASFLHFIIHRVWDLLKTYVSPVVWICHRQVGRWSPHPKQTELASTQDYT